MSVVSRCYGNSVNAGGRPRGPARRTARRACARRSRRSERAPSGCGGGVIRCQSEHRPCPRRRGRRATLAVPTGVMPRPARRGSAAWSAASPSLTAPVLPRGGVWPTMPKPACLLGRFRYGIARRCGPRLWLRAFAEARRRTNVMPPLGDEARVGKRVFAVWIRVRERYGKKPSSVGAQHHMWAVHQALSQAQQPEAPSLGTMASHPRRSAAAARSFTGKKGT